MEVKHRKPPGPLLPDSHPAIPHFIEQLTRNKKLAVGRGETFEFVTDFELPSGFKEWLDLNDIPWTKLGN